MKSSNFGNTSKGLSLFLALLICVVPLLSQSNAILDAEKMAARDVNKVLWLGAGCLFSFMGILAGYMISPSPPQSFLLGKSPRYVAVFSDAYIRKGKRTQGKYAIYGCLVGSALYTAIYFLVFYTATTSSYYWY